MILGAGTSFPQKGWSVPVRLSYAQYQCAAWCRHSGIVTADSGIPQNRSRSTGIAGHDQSESLVTIPESLVTLKQNTQQETGGVVMAELRAAHKNLYKHLSEIYFWWVEASKQENYLDTEYQKLGRTFRTVSNGINFAPLLLLIYGNNGGLNRNHTDRYSRVLNAIHEEVSKRPKYYAKDGVAKLVAFIEQAGGTTALAGYAPPQDDDDSRVANTINAETAAAEKLAAQNILKQRWMLGEYRIDTQLPVEYTSYFNTTSDDFAVLLVKRTPQGFEIVDVDGNENTVNAALANTLRKRFDLCVFSIRPLLELVYTQCLPLSLEVLAEKLVDVSTLQNDKKRKKITCHRRVLYRAATNEFILSPMNATSGVVSIIKPYFDLLLDGCDKDVYMPYTERNKLETNLRRPPDLSSK